MSRTHRSLRLLPAIALMALALHAAAQGSFPISVTTTAPMPPPLTWADLHDQAASATVTVNSTLQGVTQVSAKVSLRCQERGILITNNPSLTLSNCMDVEWGVTTYSLDELSTSFSSGFSQDQFSFSGINYTQVRDDQMLPAGYWEICVQLVACGTGQELSAPIPDGCAGWLVVESTPPMFTNICNTTFTLADGLLNVAWVYMPPPGLTDPVQYRLEIVRIDPQDGREGDANDAMLTATEPELFLRRYDAPPAMIEVPDELMLDPGYRYAVRVTVEMEGSSSFNPTVLAQSEVCSFLYQPEGLSGNGVLQAVWPRGNDWIPFDFPNVVTMFEPYRDYTRFSYTTTMQGPGSLPSYSRTLNWPSGPPGSQSMVTFDVSGYESQFLSVYQPNGALPDNSFQRGEQYRWRTTGDFTLGRNTYHGDSGEEPFRIGMGPSTPQLPLDRAVLPAGNVLLQWHTADAPWDLLPPFAVVQATAAGGTTMINGWVDQQWKLEISRQSDFSTIWRDTTGRINDPSLNILDGLNDPAALSAALYKDLTWEVNATDTGTYYWRLYWLKESGNTSGDRYSMSEVRSFCIGRCDDDGSTPSSGGGGETAEEGDEESTEAPCVSTCLEPLGDNRTPVGSLHVGDQVKVGKFQMKVTEVNGTGTVFNGKGWIQVDFLNNAHILVEFSGLKWNSEGRMVSGEVNARKDWEVPGLSYVTEAAKRIPNVPAEGVDLLENMITDNGRLVSLLMGDQELGLPIGIDRVVGDRQIILGIVNMKFEAERAAMDVVMGVELPEIHTKLAFGIGDFCFGPQGGGDEGRAYLPYDITASGDLSTTFRFRGGASTDLANLTYVDWDCHGFKCVQVAAAVEFDRGTVLPAGDHDEDGTAKVEARFKFSVCREAVHEGAVSEWNVMAAFTMDPFEVPGAPDWVFTVNEAWLDWSTIANPDGIVFPDGYTHPAVAGGGTRELWKGFYLKDLSMRTPEVIGDGTGNPLTAAVHNFMIDDQGELSFTLAVENLLAFNRGKFDSWAFSLDSVYLSVLQNNFQRGGFKGKIGLPINGEHDFVRYGAMLGYDPESREFACTLEAVLEDSLTAPLWIAQMELFPNSYVRATISNDSKVRAELNGRIGISTGLGDELGLDLGSLPSINMPGMQFEQLVLDSRDGISCRNCGFAYASPQKEVGGFPLSIRNLSLEFDDPQHPALVVEPMVSLSGGEGESSFAASVALKFTTNLDVNERGVEHFSFGDVLFTGMHLDVDVSALRLVGDLRITKTAAKEEVKGALTVGFPMGIRGDLQAIFGTVKTNPNVPINTSAQHFSYWMVDGMLYFNPGLMVMTGVGIYGFGGGAYHHMSFTEGTLPTNERLQSMAPRTPPDEIPPAQANAGDSHPDNFLSGLSADAGDVGSGAAPSGGRYQEDFNTFLGIRLGLVFGTYPKPDGCNMDLTLRGEFTSTGGLQSLTLQGNLYALVDIPKRNEARITGEIGFSYANREGNEVVHANLSVMLNYEVARGAGAGNKMVDAVFHTESNTGKWYFIMGTPDNPGGIVVGPPGGAPILSATNYIMAGNDSQPFQLPHPPGKIMEILGLNDPSRGLGTEEATRAAIGGDRDMAPLENGAGFAFGAAFQTELDINLAVLYAHIGMALGFDVLLNQIPESMICAETGKRPGDHGWYAQGQFYAGLWGELGVQLDLVFTQLRAPILDMSAAMLLQGNFPNPSGFRGHAAVNYSVLNGAVTGTAKLDVEQGKKCTMMPVGDPLAAIHFIEDLGPKGNDVSIFDLPTASYNLPLLEVLEIPKVINPDGSVDMYRFHPYVRSFTLKQLPGNIDVPGSHTFQDTRGTSSYLGRTEVLKALTSYQSRVVVGVKEEYAPFQLRDFVAPGTSTAWSEERVQNFRTGTAPDHIPDSNVDYTYPVNRQRFFLQLESNNKGRVALAMGMGYLFAPTDERGSYTYLAKFIPLGGGAPQETAITYSGGQFIPLTVPTLDNERIYLVQLLRRKTGLPDGTPLIQGGMAALGGSGSPSAILAAQISAPLTQTFIAANGDVTRMNLTGGNVARAASLTEGDHLLYSFRFRTSKYNTLQQKFASLTLDGRTPARYDDGRNADVRGEVDEHFDEADIHGVWKNGRQKLGALVRFGYDPRDSYFQYLGHVLYGPYQSYCYQRSYPFGPITVTLPRYPSAHWLLWYQKPYPVVSYNGLIKGPITDDESEAAAAPPSETPMINLPGGQAGIMSGIGGPAGIPPGSVGAFNFGGFSGFGGFGGSGSSASVTPWESFGFLYRAGLYAGQDQGTIKSATGQALAYPINMMGTTTNFGKMLLQFNQASLYGRMLGIAYQPYTRVELLHTGNLPTPGGEFPVHYNANYHLGMYFHSPIPGSRNTQSIKTFTLRHENPPSYNGGTVLY